MSFDAQQEEQRANQFLLQGKVEEALKSYKTLLRKDSKSRRLRKTVADLSMRLGNKREAEQLMLTIAETDVKEKQFRMAIPIYRELIKMRPKDYEMHLEISHCMIESNFESDALIHLKKAVEMTQRQKPEIAQEIQFRIVEMSPGELAERRTYAELLESASWSDKASDAWKEFGELNRKLGQVKESARSIERALKNREHWETRLEAAQSRFESKEPRKALEHLQQVYKDFPTEPKVLALLATGLQMVGHDAKAKQLWLEAGKRYDDVIKQSMAFDEAIACGASDEELPDSHSEIQREAAAQQLRLHLQPWAISNAKVEKRFVIKTRLFMDFKRFEDALECIRGAEGLEKRPSIFALLVETLVLNGQVDEAIEILQSHNSPNSDIMNDVQLRLVGLGLIEEDSEELIDDDLLDDDLEDLDSLEDVSEESDSDLESDVQPILSEPESPVSNVDALMLSAEGLFASGQVESALDMLNQILEIDPSNMSALEKLGTWGLHTSTNPTSPTPGFGKTTSDAMDPFASLTSDPFAALSTPSTSYPSETSFASPSGSPDSSIQTSSDLLMRPEFRLVNQYLKIGYSKEAESALLAMDSLNAVIVLTRIRIAKEQYRVALDDLQDAMDRVRSSDPSYLSALWEVGRIYSLQQRVRNTKRTLDEIADLDSTYRVEEIALWREALDLLD